MNPLLKPNFILALILILGILFLFSFIVWRQLGGNEALFAIIGHAAAWLEIVVIFYFRKKPPTT